MDFADLMLNAGLCVTVGCAVFVGRAIWTTLRPGGKPFRGSDEERSWRLDLYLAWVWSGMFLIQASSVVRHVEPGGILRLPPLAVGAVAGNLFVCGALAGRLLLRRELRWLRQKREETGRL